MWKHITICTNFPNSARCNIEASVVPATAKAVNSRQEVDSLMYLRTLFPRAALFCITLHVCLAPLGISAREAGWVPLEKYSGPLLLPKKASPHPLPVKPPVKPPAVKRGPDSSVYEGQPPVTEKELLAFVDILPQFRTWTQTQHEEAHPVLRSGRADFLFSNRAGDWVRDHGWDAPRFFCIMGKMAAALVIVEEGNDMQGTRPADMPDVTPQELSLARKHLGALLKVSFQPAPIRQ